MTAAAGVLVVGESLVDVVVGADGTRSELPGGSPMNVALGLGRLGVPVTLLTRLGADARGDRIAERLAAAGVALPLGRAEGPTSIAEATLDAEGAASYNFDVDWWLPPMPDPLPTAALVHFGSLGAALSPGAEFVEHLVRDNADAAITFDPNIRARLEPDLAAAKHRVEQHVRWSTVVKASDEDVRALYRHARLEHVARRWLSLGPALVVITRGEFGSYAVTRRGAVACPAAPTSVVDTIGAGDAVMAALIAQLVTLGDGRDSIERGVEALSPDAIEEMLGLAAVAAAITVGREGAEPPTRAELPLPALG